MYCLVNTLDARLGVAERAYEEPDPSLLHDMQLVMNASPEVLDQTLRCRPPKDRKEIQQLVGCFPSVQSRRGEFINSEEPGEIRAQSAASRPSSHADRDGKGFTPRGTAKPGSPHTPRSVPARAGSRLMKHPVAASTQVQTQPDVALSNLFGGQRPLFLEDSARREATQRVHAQLAEMGITDPTNKSGTKVLQTVWAREAPTAYRIMNQEAEKNFSAESKVPQIFARVLTPRAQEERRCLDARGSDALAEVCRTVRHYGDKKDFASEYMHEYSPNIHGVNVPRKAFKRRTDL